MLISKFNLYNDEWLDVVFANRNKEYGAYELRKHHDRDTAKALFIALFSITTAVAAYGMAIRVEPLPVVDKTKETVIELTKIPEPPKKKEEIKKPDPVESKPAPLQTTKRFNEMRAVETPVDIEPPTIDQLKDVVVSSKDNVAPGSGPATNAGPVSGGGGGEGSGENTGTTIFVIAETMPQPVGGSDAWAKFLQKNIRYPQMALSEGVSGKVYVSFIVEKDGSLSSITVLKGPGFGLDEEAARVLKKAPAWKPGIQNGQPVRVKFTIPINFSLGE